MDARPDPAPLPAAPAATRAASLRAGAVRVVEVLRTHGHQALWAGGCVRDMVLGHAPKDYDVATDATPDEVMARFERCVPVGAAFGVVRVLHGGEEYEVATFRSDFAYEDGRRPTGVRWAGAREDALRRDFTINGLFFDPLAKDHHDDASQPGDGAGELIDFVGGRADIAARVVRAIGEPRERFSEDYLRLIRGVRFAARLGFHIEAETFTAMLHLADRITRVSVERIFDEMDKILSQGDAARGVTLLEAAGLLVHILPEVDAIAAERRLQVLGPGPLPALVAWSTLLHDLEADVITRVALRLKTSRDFQRGLAEAIRGARALADWGAHTLAERKRLARLGTFAVALEVARAAGHDVTAARAEAARWTPLDLRPVPLVDGDDLRAAGLAPGPAFRAALEAVEAAQLEARVTTREAALALAVATASGAGARDR